MNLFSDRTMYKISVSSTYSDIEWENKELNSHNSAPYKQKNIGISGIRREEVEINTLLLYYAAYSVLSLRIEERPPIWRVAASKLNKQSRTAD